MFSVSIAFYFILDEIFVIYQGKPRGYIVMKKNKSLPAALFHVSPVLSVNSQIDTQNADSGLGTFLATWNEWLCESNNIPDASIWQNAIGKFLAAIKYLNVDFPLTTKACTFDKKTLSVNNDEYAIFAGIYWSCYLTFLSLM